MKLRLSLLRSIVFQQYNCRCRKRRKNQIWWSILEKCDWKWKIRRFTQWKSINSAPRLTEMSTVCRYNGRKICGLLLVHSCNWIAAYAEREIAPRAWYDSKYLIFKKSICRHLFHSLHLQIKKSIKSLWFASIRLLLAVADMPEVRLFFLTIASWLIWLQFFSLGKYVEKD